MAKINLDALEQLRETSLLNDKVQEQLKKERKAAIALAEKLYPKQVAAGIEFEHNGYYYTVSETHKKWDYKHITIDPIFNEMRAAEAALDVAQKEHDRLKKEIHKRFPNLKPKSSTKTISVSREKKAAKKEEAK